MGTFLFDYDAPVKPEEENRQMRRKCREELRSLLETTDLSTRVHELEVVNAFAFNRLTRQCLSVFEQLGDVTLVVDITCMTRVHIAALSVALNALGDDPPDVYFCYATPRSYGFQRGVYSGWKDTLFVPLGRKRLFKREGHSRGIVFPGHDEDRLSVALQELEPATGKVTYVRQEGRPDLLLRAREVNKVIEDRLLALRMPREGSGIRSSDTWDVEVVDLNDFARLIGIVNGVANAASLNEGPVMIYPFGPKPSMLFTVIMLASRVDMEAWIVYPVPESFDARYSAGTGCLYGYHFRR